MVYPNPTSDFLFLNLPDVMALKEICLFNAFGQPAGNFQDVSDDGRIDISHLPAGIYSGIARFKDAAPKSFKIVKIPPRPW
jgi:hypothetical protein